MCLRLDDSQCLLGKKSADPSNSKRKRYLFLLPIQSQRFYDERGKVLTYTFKDNGYKKKKRDCVVYLEKKKKKKKRMEGGVQFCFLTAPPFVDPY